LYGPMTVEVTPRIYISWLLVLVLNSGYSMRGINVRILEENRFTSNLPFLWWPSAPPMQRSENEEQGYP
jgi:hypothetical protein